eukprot:6206858-Pleurochrysis_carterae.AAC.2
MASHRVIVEHAASQDFNTADSNFDNNLRSSFRLDIPCPSISCKVICVGVPGSQARLRSSCGRRLPRLLTLKTWLIYLAQLSARKPAPFAATRSPTKSPEKGRRQDAQPALGPTRRPDRLLRRVRRGSGSRASA